VESTAAATALGPLSIRDTRATEASAMEVMVMASAALTQSPQLIQGIKRFDLMI
jgi:hypothetical protein